MSISRLLVVFSHDPKILGEDNARFIWNIEEGLLFDINIYHGLYSRLIDKG